MRRYDGNSGKYIHIPETRERNETEPREEVQMSQKQKEEKAMPPPKQFGSGIQAMLSDIFAQGFASEDLLLFAILFLMYQETKDKELLIIMGGMFLL